MIDGAFVAYEYNFRFNGKTLSGKCEGVTKDTKFEGLSDAKEDNMVALGIMFACAMGHKFTDGDKGPDYQEYRTTMNGGSSWQYQRRRFRMDGNRVILTDLYGEDRPVDETGIMTLDGNFLTAVTKKGDAEMTIVFKKVEE